MREPEASQRVGDAQRIVEVAAFVKDARETGANQQFLSQNFLPQIIDGLNFGEKTVAADVEAKPIIADCSGESSDGLVLLEHNRRASRFQQFP
jgi:hypothetical protein